jgi:PTH1 family peptidyl-tRNA hydrolase
MHLSGLIAGLGNPGQEYAQTRHNAGFMVIDRLLDRSGPFSSQLSAGQASRRNSLLWRCSLLPDSLPWLLLKPQTFMNLSGESVRLISAYFSIPASEILIIHDEIDLPLGRMRFKTGGGDAGHNGLKSISNLLGTREYHRLRLGVGRPADPDTVGWVLGRFSPADKELFDRILDAAVNCVLTYAKEGPKAALVEANSFTLDESHAPLAEPRA